MTAMALAALFFAGIHPLISGSFVRGRIVGLIGEGRYRGLFSLLSLLGLVWLVFAYRAAPFEPVWTPPRWLHIVAAVLMLPAFMLVVIGNSTKGPTAIGREHLLREPEPARGILRVTRHPFLVGTAIWAAMHLLVLGDRASIYFFAAFFFLGLTGPGRIDRRQRATFGEDWDRFGATTSVVPFAAILRGQNRFDAREIGLVRPAAAVAIYALFMLVAHRFFFGVSPLG